ncbi:hypothetical protein ACE1BH_20600 [Aeromonas jandaei]
MTIKTVRGKALEAQEMTAANRACLAGCDYLHAIDSPEFVKEWGGCADAYRQDLRVFLERWLATVDPDVESGVIVDKAPHLTD